MSVGEDGDRARARAAAKKNKPEPGSQAEWAMVKLTRAIVAITSVTAIIGIFAVLFAGLSWCSQNQQTNVTQNQLGLAHSQFSFAQNEAAASSNESAASLNVSADQAAAMKDMAGAADKQASAADRQALAALRQLEQNRELVAIQQQPLIDIDPTEEAKSSSFIFDSTRQAFGWTYFIKNGGRSAAFNVVTRETLTIYGRSESHSRRAAAFMAPEQSAYSTAAFHVTPEELRAHDQPFPMLKVHMDYTDQFRRKLHNEFCRALLPDGTYRVCW